MSFIDQILADDASYDRREEVNDGTSVVAFDGEGNGIAVHVFAGERAPLPDAATRPPPARPPGRSTALDGSALAAERFDRIHFRNGVVIHQCASGHRGKGP